MNVVWQGKKKSRYIIHPKYSFRTAQRCWGHTAGDGLWMDRSWRLGWTLPERAFLEKKHICLVHVVGCSKPAKPVDGTVEGGWGSPRKIPVKAIPQGKGPPACTLLDVGDGGFAWVTEGGVEGLKRCPMWAGHPNHPVQGHRQLGHRPWHLESAYHHGWCPSGGRSSLSSSLVLTHLLASSLQKKPSYRLPVLYDRSKELVRNTLS